MHSISTAWYYSYDYWMNNMVSVSTVGSLGVLKDKCGIAEFQWKIPHFSSMWNSSFSYFSPCLFIRLSSSNTSRLNVFLNPKAMLLHKKSKAEYQDSVAMGIYLENDDGPQVRVEFQLSILNSNGKPSDFCFKHAKNPDRFSDFENVAFSCNSTEPTYYATFYRHAFVNQWHHLVVNDTLLMHCRIKELSTDDCCCCCCE